MRQLAKAMIASAGKSELSKVRANWVNVIDWPFDNSRSRVWFDSMGTMYIQGAVSSSITDTASPGSSGTRVKIDSTLWASLYDLAFMASAIWAAAANRHSGTAARHTRARSPEVTRQDMPTSSSGSQDRMPCASASSKVRPRIESAAAAIHL